MSRSTPRKKYDKTFDETMNDLYFQEYDKHLEEVNKFSNALNALEETYHPSEVLCRDEQKEVIKEFLIKSIQSYGSSESLYISGVPGIGKTLCVKEVAKKICEQKSDQCKYIYTNALTVKNAIDIFKCIFYEITKHTEESKSAMYILNEYFEKGTQRSYKFNPKDTKKKKVLIIDEIDYLKTQNEEVLYNIFEWTQKKKSNLIIIAISNTMDFPQTLSPKLSSRMGNQRLSFKPYNSKQLDDILKQRVGPLNIFEDTAIIYLCKKIAQCSSDVRKCLYILRQSINEFMLRSQIKKTDRRKQIQNKKIGVEILAHVHDTILRDNFVCLFPQFPNAYKIVLYCFAKYFRSETHTCTMRQLIHLCGSFVKNQSQLKPVIMDLKDMAIIKISFYPQKTDSRMNQQFLNLKQLKEEHFSLLIDYERIIYALQKQNLDKINFRIDLNF